MSTISYSNVGDPLHVTRNMILIYCLITLLLIVIMISRSLLVQWLILFVIAIIPSNFYHHFTLIHLLYYHLVLDLVNLRGIYCHLHQPDIIIVSQT